jgi:hypothetical protein
LKRPRILYERESIMSVDVSTAPAPVNASLEAHLRVLLKGMQDGKVVSFLGAAVNLCGRPRETSWRYGQFNCLPSGLELALHLANNYGYPLVEGACPDLLRVSQYVAVMTGVESLYDELRNIFAGDYPPTALHKFFAENFPASSDPRATHGPQTPSSAASSS